MDAGTIWSYIVTVVGLTGFFLAGRKVWWAWYVNIGCQVLWFIFGLVTAQYGFLIASIVYTFIFTQNAIRWTKEHKRIHAPFPDSIPPKIIKVKSGKVRWIATEAEAQEAYLKGIPPIQDTHLIVKNTRKH